LDPDRVLDLSLDVFKACVAGYTDRIFDQQLNGVQAGYWAGYYGRAKKPTSPKVIIERMLRKKDTKDARAKKKRADEVDVDGYLAMEARFKERMGALARK